MSEEVRKSLSRRAALYVAAICVAILGLEGWREWGEHDAAVLRAELGVTNLVRSLRQHAEDTYEIVDHAISTLALRLEQGGTGGYSVSLIRAQIIDTVAQTSRLSGIYVYGPDGVVLAGSDYSSPAAGAVFEAHRSSMSTLPMFGPPIRMGPDNRQMITISRRFAAPNGTFGGVVTATIDSGHFSRFYENFDVGAHGTIALSSASGVLLARMPFDADMIGLDHSGRPLFLDELKARSRGSYQAISPGDNRLRIGGFDRSERYPIVLVVTASMDEALAPWLSGAVQRIGLTLALTLGIALLGFRLAEQICRRQQSDNVLAQKEAEFRLLAESASDLVERFDSDGRRLYISPALERMTGYKHDEMMEQSAFEVVHPDDRARVDLAAARLRGRISDEETVAFRVQHRDGRELWLETSLRIAADGAGVVGVTRDITARKLLELKLESMATVDGLTGIGNRRAFDMAMAREMTRARRTGQPLSLLMIDADRFKRFNDDYGHLAGDNCLKAIAAVVAMAAKRPGDMAARYGGEEMAVLLPETDLAAARMVAAELCRQVQGLAIPHARNLPWRVATVSIGVATVDSRHSHTVPEADWLISAADLALYDAKSQGRNQSAAASAGMPERLAG